ncbi:TNF receptor-associated factor 5-like [Sycon ciliatum]|uniref:TNF receptor-associated factor 5-like n=1 Tax=Sycon ciliatum TaxID=27933 RepID=UPI0031F66CD5
MVPNGDGLGLGTHISLKIVVMRGNFDAILHWPFKKKIQFTILDQAAAPKHISAGFIADKNSESVQRPTSEMNLASGYQRFISHELLFDERCRYLQDDTIFFKVQIKDRLITKILDRVSSFYADFERTMTLLQLA